MKCGTRSLAVLGALALSALGLVPAAWAADVGQSGEVEASQSGAVQIEGAQTQSGAVPVSYTHLRAHET